mgnify:CR=1 FL=1
MPQPARPCVSCGRLLTRRQMSHRRQRYCSNECRAPRYTTRLVLLDILRANTYAWMSTSVLSIWVYGFDDRAELVAVRALIRNLRHDDYGIESVPVTWGRRGQERAYCLISEPQTAQRRTP